VSKVKAIISFPHAESRWMEIEIGGKAEIMHFIRRDSIKIALIKIEYCKEG